MFKIWETYIQAIPRTSKIHIGVILCLGIAYLDCLSGWNVSLSVVYLLPIFFISWYVGKKPGIEIAVLSALLRLSVEITRGILNLGTLPIVFNVLMRLVLFIFAAYILASIKQTLILVDSLAKFDSLTRIPNRRYFHDLCGREIARMQRQKHLFTVGYLDIDDFKNVNDTLGHSEGDNLLKEVAKTLEKKVRSTDVVARLGGDEFAVIVSQSGVEEAVLFFSRLKEALDGMIAENQWPVSFSVGVMTFLTPPQGVDAVLRYTDALMYKAKKNGKNKICFEKYDIPLQHSSFENMKIETHPL